jgi:antitoxin VapB
MAEPAGRGKGLPRRTAASTFRDVDRGLYMTINITNKEADALTRRLAKIEGVGVTEAVVLAMKEALAKRNMTETPLETAARIRAELGIVLTDEMRKPLPRSVFHEMSGETPEWIAEGD